MEGKNKTTAGLLAIFLGAFGAHYFYLGDSEKGTTRLLLSLLLPVCGLVFAIMGIVDGIRFLTYDEEQYREYCVENLKIPSETFAEPKQGEAPKYQSSLSLSYAEKFRILRRYTELLDSEAISRSEFDCIKDQIMGVDE